MHPHDLAPAPSQDALYLHYFDVYSEIAFMLIFASKKGKGKSIRCERMSGILPPGWATANSTSSTKSGMNGNNSPSNGTQVFYDECPAELKVAAAHERIEFWKTILTQVKHLVPCRIPSPHRIRQSVHAASAGSVPIRASAPWPSTAAAARKTTRRSRSRPTIMRSWSS